MLHEPFCGGLKGLRVKRNSSASFAQSILPNAGDAEGNVTAVSQALGARRHPHRKSQ